MKRIKNTMSRTDILIVTKEPFPIGMAATNRILSYAKELAKQKNVKIIIAKPTEKKPNVINDKYKGEMGDLKFEYASKTTIWPKEKTKVIKLIILLRGYVNLTIRIFQLKPRVVIIYSGDFNLRKLVFLLRKIQNFKILIEETEYPKILKKDKDKDKIEAYFKHYRKCDGVIVISRELKDYYEKIGTKSVFLLPMTIETDRFLFDVSEEEIEDYFVYVGGSGGFVRDGVRNIIEGFSYFSKDNPKYKLYIVGLLDKNTSLFEEINSFIKNEHMADKIIFKGIIHSPEIPGILKRAKGIVMAPQKNFNSGGFPTKLGEFLASGRPVITTNVSEIPLYLSKKNSFLIEPHNDLLIAKAMQEIVNNENEANEIGRKGQKVAARFFSIHTYKKELIDFIFEGLG